MALKKVKTRTAELFARAKTTAASLLTMSKTPRD